MDVDPLLPWPVIVVLGVVAAVLVVARIRRRAPLMAVIRAIAMVVLATAIAIDPALAGGSSEARRAAADVLFVVDSTSSMAALDHDGDAERLDGVRADIAALAAEFPGAHFSLIRFDSQARLEVPWTTDLGALETAVSVLRQERALYSRGSQLDVPLQVIDEQLPRPSAGDGGPGDDGYSVVFYFSDGEVRRPVDTNEQVGDRRTGQMVPDDEGELAITTFAELAPDVDGGAVFGYGTPEGAPMIEFVGTDELFTAADSPDDSPYVLDYATGQPAISRLDEENLVAIADELGVPYVHRSEPGGLGAMGRALANAAPTVSDGSRETVHRLYWIPALALLAVLLWQAAVTTKEALATQRILGGPARPIGNVEGHAPAPAWRPTNKEPAA